MSPKAAVSYLAPAVQLEDSFQGLSGQALSGQDLSSLHPLEQEIKAEGLSVQVAASLREIKDLRRVWRKWTQCLDTDIDYFSHNLKNDSTILRPHVITVWKDGIAQAMLVGLVKKRRVSTVVSFVNIPGPDVVVLEIVNGGRM